MQNVSIKEKKQDNSSCEEEGLNRQNSKTGCLSRKKGAILSLSLL